MGVIADKIRRAIFGGEVRDSIADGIEVVEQLREDYDNQVINAGNSNAEIVDARGNYVKLKERLDKEHGEVISQLDNIEMNKAGIDYVNEKTQGVSLAYKESYETLEALQLAYPSGDSYNHVVLSDGNIYTWVKNIWKNTNIQGNGTGISNNSINDNHLGSTIKSVVSVNKLIDYFLSSNRLSINGALNLKTEIVNGNLTVTKTNDKTFGFLGFSLKNNLIFDVTNNTTWYMFSENNLKCRCIGLQGVDIGKIIEIDMNTQTTSYIKTLETSESVSVGDTLAIDFKINTDIYLIKNNEKVLLFKIDDECNRCGFVVGGLVGLIIANAFDGKIEKFLKLKSILGSNNYWYDKLWLTFGDSITYLNKYQPIICKNKGIKYIDRAWNGGRTIELLKMLRETIQDTCDLLSVLIGTNDFMMHMPIGTPNDTTEGTFYGNLDVFCREAIEKFPHATIFFMTPLQRWGYTFEDKETTMTNDEGIHLSQYADAVIEVANRYGFPVLDLYRNSQFNRYNIMTYTYDGLHPNDSPGYTKLAKLIGNFIETLG